MRVNAWNFQLLMVFLIIFFIVSCILYKFKCLLKQTLKYENGRKTAVKSGMASGKLFVVSIEKMNLMSTFSIFYFLTELSIVSNLTDLLIYADDLAIYIKN